MKRDDPVKMELILDGIQKKFGEKEVLRGVSFPFEQGKIYGLLGRNGAGKTTLFNCLSNEISMDAGTAQLKDVSGTLRALTPEDIGYVFSTPILPDFLTGREFLKFFMEINRDKIQMCIRDRTRPCCKWTRCFSTARCSIRCAKCL